MSQQVLQTLLLYLVVYVVAFEDFIYVYGQGSQEMTEKGRTQYQLLKERSNLPKYGPCWKAALQTLDEGCRQLSEETQSDIALHITNCFLEMSGHETYNCELDKKPNLRAICINSMTDRAFNVYTEFYTHTQNICWFLRGQIWHETIAENTLRVGKQLELTAENQEYLLKAQKESLDLQEKMLKHGRVLEGVLDEIYMSSQAHQEVLKLLTQSIINLQSWVVGEVSWIDSVLFYALAYFLIYALTSTGTTSSARLPMFILLSLVFMLERLTCSFMISYGNTFNVSYLYISIHNIIWFLRYGFVCIACLIFIYKSFISKSVNIQNYEVLYKILGQNNEILQILECLKLNNSKEKTNISYLNESGRKPLEIKTNGNLNGSLTKSLTSNSSSFLDDYDSFSIKEVTELDVNKSTIENRSFRKKLNHLGGQIGRYNLRSSRSVSRQSTPDTTHLH
ncbi:unnamed protein product [Acanthoscelides obtectus]|uniref:Protein GAMETE EXPRESSED 1 n=1 Tax=Acanthoscelides obtectus TaxID=200917 RepID=A0A9P0K963_ACAOB|nr:unnamed protein product [Acanthoscelides obtectus]CAK1666847.1 hypothetical protein AOBTE_LOCUS25519 [Acanthoscelides obtectus]